MVKTEVKKEEDERVEGRIRRVRRAYWRAHCKTTIPPPKELARRLLLVDVHAIRLYAKTRCDLRFFAGPSPFRPRCQNR